MWNAVFRDIAFASWCAALSIAPLSAVAVANSPAWLAILGSVVFAAYLMHVVLVGLSFYSSKSGHDPTP